MIVQKSNKVLVNIWKLRRVLKKEKTKIRRGNQKMRATKKCMVVFWSMWKRQWMRWLWKFTKGERLHVKTVVRRVWLICLQNVSIPKRDIQAKPFKYSIIWIGCQAYQNTHFQANKNWQVAWFITQIRKIWYDLLFWLAHVSIIAIGAFNAYSLDISNSASILLHGSYALAFSCNNDIVLWITNSNVAACLTPSTYDLRTLVLFHQFSRNCLFLCPHVIYLQ